MSEMQKLVDSIKTRAAKLQRLGNEVNRLIREGANLVELRKARARYRRELTAIRNRARKSLSTKV